MDLNFLLNINLFKISVWVECYLFYKQMYARTIIAVA